jgi:hypothetical protein
MYAVVLCGAMMHIRHHAVWVVIAYTMYMPVCLSVCLHVCTK